jgi:cell division protein FtsN
MKVEGQGDASFKASEGGEANGKIDMSAKPETAVASAKAPKAPAAKPIVAATKAVTTAVPAASAKMPVPAIPVPAVTGTSGLVQLGAYGSQVGADQAWATLAGKVPGMAGMNKSVLPAAVGGSTVYRLRAQAGTPAGAEALCAKAKSAGTPCMIVR